MASTETGARKHEHLMTDADQEKADALKNEILDLCLHRKVNTLVALSAARCAAECFESIINEQDGEVFTVGSPSDAEQLIELRKALLGVRNGMGCWCNTPFVNISEDRPHEPRCLAAFAALNPKQPGKETQ